MKTLQSQIIQIYILAKFHYNMNKEELKGEKY